MPKVKFVAAALLLASVCVAQTPATKPAQPQVAATAPAADLLTGIVDPYDQGAVRAAFLKAAGVDSELSADEFAADAKAGGGFAQRFDRWTDMARFDKNATGMLDWPEFETYRLDLRTRVLNAFDADNNGKLNPPERELAIASLLAGTIPAARITAPMPHGPIAAGTSRPSPVAKLDPVTRQKIDAVRKYFGPDNFDEFAKAYDADKDGKISLDERSNAYTAFMKAYRQVELENFDVDKNGSLDDAERKVMHQTMAKAMMEEQLEKYDKNGNGKLDPEEFKVLLEDGKKIAERYAKRGEEIAREQELRTWDTNKDGKIDEAETARRKEIEAQWLKDRADREKRMIAEWDKDGDGKLSLDETKARNAALAQQAKQDQEARLKKMDLDGDGKVSEEERTQYNADLKRKYDADGDGKLSGDEMKKMFEIERTMVWE